MDNVPHIIPANHSVEPHWNAPNCWCCPTFVPSNDSPGVWMHRGELLNSDINLSESRHNLNG